MPRNILSEREVDAGRQILSAAALRLYKEHGDGAVSFRKLAIITGTSHTQPYRYFESKEQLLAAVRLDCYRRFAELIRSSDVAGAHPAVRLKSIHGAILDYVRAEPTEYQLMFALDQPSLLEYPKLLSVRREAFDYVVDIVQQAVDQDLLRGEARDIMHIVWGAMHGLLCLETAGQLLHGRSLDELTEPLLKRVLHPLFDDGH